MNSGRLSRAAWQMQLMGKSPREMAQHIIGNLIGYRSMSKYRTDDTDSLALAIEAISSIQMPAAPGDAPTPDRLRIIGLLDIETARRRKLGHLTTANALQDIKRAITSGSFSQVTLDIIVNQDRASKQETRS